MNDTQRGSYKIRPAGSHLRTIGSDLIQDTYAAVIELVKNAYDADSPNVNISFTKDANQKYSVCIEDHGHGMTRDVVIKKWLVPSTNDKLLRKTSPAGRIMQGRKGVGRYASSILGKDLLLETITETGEKTTVYIEWDLFNKAEYLDEVEILIETTQVKEPKGTKLTITGDEAFSQEWSKDQFDKLLLELRKLKSPIPQSQIEKYFPLVVGDEKRQNLDKFDIFLTISGFSSTIDTENKEIVPFPLFDLYDYQIAGFFDASGKGELTYSTQKIKNASAEKINLQLPQELICGRLYFDIRVYDRDKDAIEQLIKRGLVKENGDYFGKLEARNLLNTSNGIGVYRNGFRIRPLGDAGFDWLTLDAQRVQEPARCIGCNQVIGCVVIDSEEASGLIENSARDGFKENSAYMALQAVSKRVIRELETRRYTYRKKAGLSRPALKIEREFEKLFSFSDIKDRIHKRLKQHGTNEETISEIIEILSSSEQEKNKIVDDIRNAVAIYQGQATLGKIINVVLHEGRKPLNYFKNQTKNLTFWIQKFLSTNDKNTLEHINPIADGFEKNTNHLAEIFSRIDPLAAGRRTAKSDVNIYEEIKNCSKVFESTLKKKEISISIIGDRNINCSAWRQDIYSIFTNLIDNSIYWLTVANTPKKLIEINIVTNSGHLAYIDYRDNGTGIDESLIESNVIFEPDFSTKPEGTGLGLAIAGEAAERNNFKLSAIADDNGALFRLEPILQEEE